MKFIFSERISNTYEISLQCNPKFLYPNFHISQNITIDNINDIIRCINPYIPITTQEYARVLLQYNATHYSKGIFLFKNLVDANNAVNYLNEKYTVMINLIARDIL